MEKGQRLAAANGACDQGIQGGGEMLRNVCRSPGVRGPYLCLDCMDWTYFQGSEMRLKMQRGGSLSTMNTQTK